MHLPLGVVRPSYAERRLITCHVPPDLKNVHPMPTVGITVARRTTGRLGFGDHAELEAGMMPFYVGAGSPLEQPAGRTQ